MYKVQALNKVTNGRDMTSFQHQKCEIPKRQRSKNISNENTGTSGTPVTLVLNRNRLAWLSEVQGQNCRTIRTQSDAHSWRVQSASIGAKGCPSKERRGREGKQAGLVGRRGRSKEAINS
jgi:hypothetical protein